MFSLALGRRSLGLCPPRPPTTTTNNNNKNNKNNKNNSYATEKLWGALKMGAVPIVWGGGAGDGDAASVARARALLPSPEAAIFAADFPSDAALAEYVA